MVHDADPPAQQRGWDFGAVDAFKSVFNYAAEVIQKNTVGRAQSKIEGLGFKLNPEQMSGLVNYTLKLGESALIPVPSDELKLTTGAESFERKIGNADVTMEDLEIQGLSFWIYSFATWEGPTIQIEKIRLGSITVIMDSFSFTGSVEIGGIKVQDTTGDITNAVLICLIDRAAEVEHQLPVEEHDGEQKRVVPETVKETIQARTYETVLTKLTSELKLQIDSLKIDLHGLQITEGGIRAGEVHLTAENTELGVGIDKGAPTLAAHTELNIGGAFATEALGVIIQAAAEGKAVLDAQSGKIRVEPLKVGLNCAGTYDGEDVELDAILTVSQMVMQATSNTDSIVDVVGTACREALTSSLPAVIKAEGFAYKPPGEAVMLIARAAQAALVTRARASLAGEFNASISKINVNISRAKYGEHEAAMDMTLSGVQADAGLTQAQGGGSATLGNATATVDLTASGKAKVDQAEISAALVADGALDAQAGTLEVSNASFNFDAGGTYSGADVLLKGSLVIKDIRLSGTATGSTLLASLNTGVGKAIADGCEAVLALPDLGQASAGEISDQFTGWMNLRLMQYVAESLQVQLKASIGDIALSIDKARYDGQKGEGSLKARGLEVGVSITSSDEGPQIGLDQAHGEVQLDLKGQGRAKVGDVNVEVTANSAGAKISLDKGEAAVSGLDCIVVAIGTVGQGARTKLLKATLTIKLEKLSIKTLGSESGLQDCVARAVGTALSAAASGFFSGEDLSGLAPAIAKEVQKTVATELETQISIKVSKLNVFVNAATLGDLSVENAQISLEEGGVDLSIDPEDPVEVDFYGDLLLSAMTKYKNGNFIEFHGLHVQLNGAGTGHVEGSFQLHSDGVKEWTGSPVLGKFSKAINKTMVMRVPINGYTVQLNGINLGMPAWVAKKILGFATSKIRVSNKSGETLLKLPAISGYSGSALGQLDPSEGTQRILTAKQEFAARDSQGAISIEALLQNNIQRQLNAVRSTLDNV